MQFKKEGLNLQGFDSLSRKEKIIFLAGVFDGEGCLGAYTVGKKGKGKKYLSISVESTDVDVISRFIEVFGGNLLSIKRRHDHYKNSFKWKLVGKKAWPVIAEMIPYMCLRRRQKYVTLEPHRHSIKDGRRNIQKQESNRDSYVGSSIVTCRKNETWGERVQRTNYK